MKLRENINKNNSENGLRNYKYNSRNEKPQKRNNLKLKNVSKVKQKDNVMENRRKIRKSEAQS